MSEVAVSGAEASRRLCYGVNHLGWRTTFEQTKVLHTAEKPLRSGIILNTISVWPGIPVFNAHLPERVPNLIRRHVGHSSDRCVRQINNSQMQIGAARQLHCFSRYVKSES